jgi:hypothetical protein
MQIVVVSPLIGDSIIFNPYPLTVNP